MKYSFFNKMKVKKNEIPRLKRLVRGLWITEVVLFLIFLIVNLMPFLWGLLTSLRPIREVLSYPPKIFGFNISFEHYNEVFRSTFLQGVLNSLMYAAIAIPIGLFLALTAAYAIRRFRFVGRKAFFILILTGIPLAIGSAAMVVPNYTFFSMLGMTNHWYTLPIVYIGYNLPIATFVMLGGMDTVPIEIDEAAKVDGAGRWYILFRIVFPLTLPAVASAALFIFLGSWNEFIVSSVLVNTNALYPIQVSIYNYIGYFGINWGPLTAAATTAVIPTLIVFSILGRLLISGLTAGSLKY